MKVKEIEKLELLDKMWESNKTEVYNIVCTAHNAGEMLTEYEIEKINNLVDINNAIEDIQIQIADSDWNEELWKEEDKEER